MPYVLDQVMGHPLVKKALAAGEERMGRIVSQLLASEKLAHGAQTAVAGALSAKAVLERGVKTAMQAVNLPSTEDVEELRKKLADLEELLDSLAYRVETTPGEPGAKRGGE